MLFVFLIYNFIYFIYLLFIFGYAGSLAWRAEAILVATSGLLISVASLVVEHGLLGPQVPVIVALGLSSCGSQALERWLSSWCRGLVAPWPVGSSGTRDEPVPPALGDGFFITGHQASPSCSFLKEALVTGGIAF